MNISSHYNYSAAGSDLSNMSDENRMEVDTSYTNHNNSSLNKKLEQHCDIFRSTLTFQTSSPKPTEIIREPKLEPYLDDIVPSPEKTSEEESLLKHFYVNKCLNNDDSTSENEKIEPKIIKPKISQISYVKISWLIILPMNLAITALLVSNYFHFDEYGLSKDFFDTKALEQDLTNNLYDQNLLIKDIIKIAENVPGNKFNILIGNSGVGKTLTINSLIRHCQFSRNIIHLISPIHIKFGREKLKLIENLSDNTDFNLIVIDSLKINDLNDQILNNFLVEVKNYPVIVFLAVTGSNEELENGFVKNLRANVLKFPDLSKLTIIKCIQSALRKRNLPTTDTNIENVIRDLGNFNSGCKRIDSKVAVLYENPDLS